MVTNPIIWEKHDVLVKNVSGIKIIWLKRKKTTVKCILLTSMMLLSIRQENHIIIFAYKER